MLLLTADDPTLPHFTLADFELGLDQSDNGSAAAEKSLNRGKN
jgi:hypothetical protein